MKFEKKINIIDLLNLVILVVGGILGYFFIESQKKEEAKANTNLATIQTDIAKIEKEHKESGIKLDENLKKVSFTVDISDFISNIQPNLEVKLAPTAEPEDENIILVWEITNSGKHTIIIDDLILLLSLNTLFKNSKAEDLLKEGIDYIILSRKDIGELPAGQKIFMISRIKPLNNKIIENNKLFYYLKLNTKVIPSIHTISRKILKDYFNDQEIENLTSKSFGRDGQINIKYQTLF